MSDSPAEWSEDGFLGGRLTLRQPRKGHRAGHDALLLAASTTAQAGDRVIDFGAGVGAAGLALASRVSALDLVLVEFDPGLAAVARGNAGLNGLAARVIALDVAAGRGAFLAAGLLPDSADVVLMNPPFNDPRRYRGSPDESRAAAHVATHNTLVDWTHAARRLLKSGGALTMIWRAEGLADVLRALERGFGGIAIQPVHSSRATAAIRILVRAVKGGCAPLQMMPGLMLESAEVQDVLRGQGVLPLAR